MVCGGRGRPLAPSQSAGVRCRPRTDPRGISTHALDPSKTRASLIYVRTLRRPQKPDAGRVRAVLGAVGLFASLSTVQDFTGTTTTSADADAALISRASRSPARSDQLSAIVVGPGQHEPHRWPDAAAIIRRHTPARVAVMVAGVYVGGQIIAAIANPLFASIPISIVANSLATTRSRGARVHMLPLGGPGDALSG